MKVAVTGGTGFVGQRVVEKLEKRGDEIILFTRSPEKAMKVFPKNNFSHVTAVAYTPKESGEWQNAVSGCDGVVNLAGESLSEGRWTENRKREIIASREVGTQKLVEAIDKAESKPSVLVNASAIGYYGTSETATFDESSPPGNDFLAEVCKRWEGAAEKVKNTGVRLAILRFGIVLGNGGAIAKLIPPFKLYAGGPIGSGKQWFSWVHREDVVNLILHSLDNPDMAGVYNATAPHPVRMQQFCDTLGRVMNRPSWLPVPGFVIETLLGDGAVVVLEGQEVLPKATQKSGFEFQYSHVKDAITSIVKS
ncbi:TIGR01777 family oxidoreductase [Spirulina sp. CS-785/01]|uniref:thylakoid membrane protein ThyD n=1 Tax=Spirulina sp. CS-785/01 TaxID=3021716 RepID=UPI00232B0CD4|nr:TIGR01777 family oxidoreductase [Spirulina sp. CS-785/01]MDB9315061.1 TIGR01777 family oxidoreductase [Spirulina sp. CS-785/01]